ncbi:MAG: phytanoyl-CoA dioxygenase family protein [Rhizomicrobium sp.]
MNVIDDAARTAYETDGVVCLRNAFAAHWIETLREATEVAMAEPGPHAGEYTAPGAPGRFFGDLDIWRRHEPFRRFVFESPAAEITGLIMRAKRVNFFYDQLLVKEPGTGDKTPWHQDQPYWAVSGRQVCSIWLPLDVVDRETSVEYIAGSHRWGREYIPQHFKDGSPYEGRDLPKLPDIDAERDKHRILSWDMEPGDCLVFQAMIVHGARGNSSLGRRRRALATRWTGDDARYCIREGETAIPTTDPGLKHGDRMDCESFPPIWSSPDA